MLVGLILQIEALSSQINDGVNSSSQHEKLVGEWSGAGGKIVLNEDGTGYLGSAMCSAKIQWHASKSELNIHYLTAVECYYNDPQLGKKRSKKIKPDETIRYKIGKADLMGMKTMRLTLYSRTAPNGAEYDRPLRADEQKGDNNHAMTKEQCRDKIAEETRKCERKSKDEVDICKILIIGRYIDCM